MKRNKSLGKGLDALIKTEDESLGTMLKDKKVEEVIREVKNNPRITLWSMRAAAVLRYLKKTKPGFSISKEASTLIEKAIKDKYPDIWRLFSKLE
ncbi:conserved hypothetical protein [Methanothermus fervidus DSM 2088]|uniref:Uncharacterized protein n=1 Tax=Methanothermus fervidus (strain ATCC 43054 / DSM 2088 / JCM 10308 / V24 S) TaxID=523846 RepID=E3GWC8_METFV|nr:hypothetical protein [Methanothermus fervidus]ADP77893.1 conserved hypothetical protein [Methanothermus fervidus DSM 2088]